MKRIICAAFCFLILTAVGGMAQEKSVYTYNFPKPPADWGPAVSFGNLSPGFFQVLYQNKTTGVVKIATYGIVGASMDNLKDPQLMMVFSFDQKAGAAKKFLQEKLAIRD
ncbi:hypothetical protein A2625_01175 [candidate division WOR-1 bacterium RIFCSPHIGHO2_01_FULL_53_15]|uniref:Uncharacterized protein n=1 Tax=candidate division WOR-1 bacterium RIFCSPHIGHO2_01_FULL_53_15 TaxID=1802564 RepID=A0A1F4Q0G6_UNCSA|nr:MAG: hypothetical protein A2625_01175 [candidate division WOR-1 bacterium RIFCSPHIGHO2_01_FULL_53_15]OGC10760.1 MAG: hypothetical protein A3D23_04685 [candidate division WOR-1 bacterium RIFCSPHIGHO2_02_FULL_53_26]